MSKRPQAAHRSGYRRSTAAENAFRIITPSVAAGSLAGCHNGVVEVTVLLFASVAEKAGTRRVTVAVEHGDTVARVRDRVVDRFPQLESSLPTLLYALNEEYVKEWEPVTAGSTLALIPPVSGG